MVEQRVPRPPRSYPSARNLIEELPYRVELQDRDTDDWRIIARAQSNALARSIFQAACLEYPERSIVLVRGMRVIARQDV